MKKLLLVEDDESLGATLQERLQKEGYTVEWARSIREARAQSESTTFGLVILDVGLPDGTGTEFAKELRKRAPTPFIFVTARNSAEDRLEGYEIGAEEYIPKPFHLKELLLRVKHVLEEHGDAPETSAKRERRIRCLGRTIDLDAMAIEGADGKREFLAARDNRLLEFLIGAAPRVVSRDEILDEIWGEEKFPSSRTVDNAMVRLRQAIGDRDGAVIRSVRGVGYQWVNSEN
ncbi:MAG: response regulator transcription factor [Bdellovibrionales bacterium]|nr:response regulator transcription factor [Bdellovibrionales bacterium]